MWSKDLNWLQTRFDRKDSFCFFYGQNELKSWWMTKIKAMKINTKEKNMAIKIWKKRKHNQGRLSDVMHAWWNRSIGCIFDWKEYLMGCHSFKVQNRTLEYFYIEYIKQISNSTNIQKWFNGNTWIEDIQGLQEKRLFSTHKKPFNIFPFRFWTQKSISK